MDWGPLQERDWWHFFRCARHGGKSMFIFGYGGHGFAGTLHEVYEPIEDEL